jgi:hypothetical protein
MASAHRPTIASHSAMRSVSNSMSWTKAPGAKRRAHRPAGRAAAPASVQPTSLGTVRQSMVFLVMVISF